MAAIHWVEILKCHKCGRAGLAELWDHEGHADIVPPGFRMQAVQIRAGHFSVSAVRFV